eukprot:jgi/Mesen1/6050/ME000308S05243
MRVSRLRGCSCAYASAFFRAGRMLLSRPPQLSYALHCPPLKLKRVLEAQSKLLFQTPFCPPVGRHRLSFQCHKLPLFGPQENCRKEMSSVKQALVILAAPCDCRAKPLRLQHHQTACNSLLLHCWAGAGSAWLLCASGAPSSASTRICRHVAPAPWPSSHAATWARVTSCAAAAADGSPGRLSAGPSETLDPAEGAGSPGMPPGMTLSDGAAHVAEAAESGGTEYVPDERTFLGRSHSVQLDSRGTNSVAPPGTGVSSSRGARGSARGSFGTKEGAKRTRTNGDRVTAGAGGMERTAGGTPGGERRPGWHKKKVAIWLAYVGTPFHGLQIQRSPQAPPTVEGELEKAILAAGNMRESNFGALQKLGWSRSSRTDKGVHSVATVVAMKMEMPAGALATDQGVTALAAGINAHLPPSVRVLSVVPVAKSFTARRLCQARTYHYLLPARLLLGDGPPRPEAPAASAPPSDSASSYGSPSQPEKRESGGELSKERLGAGAAQEQGEEEEAVTVARLRAILALFEGKHAFHNYTVRRLYRAPARPQAPDAAAADAGAARAGPDCREASSPPRPPQYDRRAQFDSVAPREGEGSNAGLTGGAPSGPGSTDGEEGRGEDLSSLAPALAGGPTGPAGDGTRVSSRGSSQRRGSSSARHSAEDKEGDGNGEQDEEWQADGVLQASALPPGGPVARNEELAYQKAFWVHEPDKADKISSAHYRKLLTCTCGEVETHGGARFVRIVLKGESFMLHQIRKIVGTALAVHRGLLPAELVQVSLARHSRVVLPLAPPETLVLAHSEFFAFPAQPQKKKKEEEGKGNPQEEPTSQDGSSPSDTSLPLERADLAEPAANELAGCLSGNSSSGSAGRAERNESAQSAGRGEAPELGGDDLAPSCAERAKRVEGPAESAAQSATQEVKGAGAADDDLARSASGKVVGLGVTGGHLSQSMADAGGPKVGMETGGVVEVVGVRADKPRPALEMSELTMRQVASFWSDTLLPSLVPFLDASGEPWDKWMSQMHSLPLISDEEMEEVVGAWRQWRADTVTRFGRDDLE